METINMGKHGPIITHMNTLLKTRKTISNFDHQKLIETTIKELEVNKLELATTLDQESTKELKQEMDMESYEVFIPNKANP